MSTRCEPVEWLECQQALLHDHPLPSVLTSMEGATLFANPAACRLFDFPPDSDVPLPPLFDFVHPDEVDRALWLQMDFLRERATHFDAVLRMRTTTGRPLILRVVERIIESPDGLSPVILFGFEDQTLLHGLQVRRREFASMHSIMTLASDSAHDLISLLSAIRILASEVEDAPPSVREKLASIASTSERAAELARPLLSFSQSRTIKTRTSNINRVIQDVVRRLQSLIGRRHVLQLSLPPHPVIVLNDVMLLEQVLLNLVSNAAQAMAQGGVIRISLTTEDVPPTPDSPTRRRYALLSVADSGVGMDHATQDRATERSFTTRAHQGGNGLGLSIVKRIVDGFDGSLNITSAPGQGTTVQVRLPLADYPSPANVRIALLDANPLRRATIRHTITVLGYNVIESGTVDEARSRFGSEGPPDLLLSAVDVNDGARPDIEQRFIGVRVVYFADSGEAATEVCQLGRQCIVVPQDVESRKSALDAFITQHLSTDDWNG